jgi:predicted ATPase/class 3 adenylate cyclase
MTDAPRRTTGTVTFLFTDIEGSTRLEQQIGTSRYGEQRERHRAILREVWTAHGGQEKSTEGDSFFVVFASAKSAVIAAVAGQRALAAEPWPDDAPIRVRMGLHTGEAEIRASAGPDAQAGAAEVGAVAAPAGRADDATVTSMAGDTLVSLDINRAARVASAAHGGQILASEATRILVARDLPPDIHLRDLGAFRLKDLLTAEHLVAVIGDGLPADFPPPRTPDAHPNNLPTQLTTFVGRDMELAEAADLLARTRLLTLTGPGGTGKTRLSLQLASLASDDYPDGVFFVPLEPIRDPMLVAARIASIVGVTEGGVRPIADSLADWLRDRTTLLVLDNFEQVVAAAPLIADLLGAAPRIKVLATSRAPLRVSGEQEYPVHGLPVPPDPSQRTGLERFNVPGDQRAVDAESLGQYGAVRLFIERAVAVRPGFTVTNENAPAVAAISARLQGMPLAIELAAARIKLLGPDAILARLEHQLDVLAAGSRDLPERQQTLRGAIAWSYDLLDDGARRLFDRLSVFVGGFDLDAAGAIAGPPGDIGGDVLDGLTGLVDQSLLKVDAMPDGEPRFRMLESIRDFAAERLEARGERDLVAGRHRDWFTALAARAADELSGDTQRVWLDRLDRDHDDIRAVLDRAVAEPDPPVAIGLAFSMWRFWQKRGHLAEARRRLEAMAAAPWSRDDPRLRAKLMEALGGTCWWQGQIGPMAVRYDEALELWLAIGDEAEIANAYYNASFRYAVPEKAGLVGYDADPDGIGVDYIERARDLFHELGDQRGEANAMWALGNYRYFRRFPGNGVAEFRQALEMFRSTGDATMEAWGRHMLGTALLRGGEVAEARANIVEAARHFQAAGDAAGLALSLDDLSAVAVAEGDLPRAARLRGAARSLTAETGAELAGFVEDTFETGARPGVRSVMSEEDVARYGAEGAAMTLDEAVAYALGTGDPVAHRDASEA